MADPNIGSGLSFQDRKFVLGALGILLLLTFADFFGTSANANAQKLSSESAAPKFATKFMGPSIKFAYW